MAILLDTSVLGRLANRTDVSYPTATAAVAKLHRQGETLHICPQNLIEFRNFATRPISANGLGLPATAAEALATTYESVFPLLEETPDIYPTWKSIANTTGIIGRQVHDARLVAICHVHSVTHLLTFNVAHFARMAGIGQGIVVLDPSVV